MARLDFSERYDGRGRDELADLGNSLNVMSDTLESAIRDLREANSRLSRDVEEKTRQNEARRAFISNVSHELKTPIALIQTYAEGLREDIAAGAGNRAYYCEVIEDESQKMSQMIKKMTLLMQLEDGSSQLEPGKLRRVRAAAQSHAEKRHPVCGKARAGSSCRPNDRLWCGRMPS